MFLNNLLDQPLASWMQGGGENGDIVLSSRIRLARNICGIPFPNRADAGCLAQVTEKMRSAVNGLSETTGANYLFVELEQLTPLERNVLVEKHIISPNHAAQPEKRALVVSDDAAVSIMVNEEDHLRIQCLLPGLNLEKTLALAYRIDDAIEAKIDLAFSEQMGYLTACPTNLGTGLRASVMMHLPGLVFTRQINRIVSAATQLGLAVRGLYGEGTEAVGNIFQISNQLTLGFTEQEIVENLSSVVRQIIDHERAARKGLYMQSSEQLTDRMWRAYGVLRYAHSIDGQEALALLSEVRLGIDLGIIEGTPQQVFNELLVITRPNFLQKLAGNADLSQTAINRFRAQLIREKLAAVK